MTALRLPPRSQQSLDGYERRFKWPLLIVSLLYLVVVLIEMLPGFKVGLALMVVDGLFWLVFIVDYVWRVFFLAPDRWAYARTWICLLDLFVIVSFPALLVLNRAVVGSAVRIVAQGIRLLRVGAQAGRAVGQGRGALTRKSVRWFAPLALLVVVFVILYVWRFEEAHSGGNMSGFGDTLWWAVETMTTVGYGDVVPESPEARIVAAILMFVGIGVVGWLTAALASLFVDNDDAPVDAEMHRKLDDILVRLAALEATTEGMAARAGTRQRPKGRRRYPAPRHPRRGRRQPLGERDGDRRSRAEDCATMTRRTVE